jgi:hypothetical protein
MWPKWTFEHLIDSELWELMPDSLMKLVCVVDLVRVCVQKVNVQIETTTGAVGYGFWEGGISAAFLSWLRVYEGFRVRPIRDFLTGGVLGKLH